jgi:hypothetical protein
MRAPSFYADPDLQLTEVRPGYISPNARGRAGIDAARLGCVVTELKPWLRPDSPCERDIAEMLKTPKALRLHGMTRIAFDDETVYINGKARPLAEADRGPIAALCRHRALDRAKAARLDRHLMRWLLAQGAFEQNDQE